MLHFMVVLFGNVECPCRETAVARNAAGRDKPASLVLGLELDLSDSSVEEEECV